MDGTSIASQIIQNLLSGLTEILTRVPRAIASSFEALFIAPAADGATTQSLSVFSVIMLVFGGITLAFGLTKLVYNLVRSKVG